MDPHEHREEETPLQHEDYFTRVNAPSPFLDEEQPALLQPVCHEDVVTFCPIDEPIGLQLGNKPAAMRHEKAKKAKVAPKRTWLRVDLSGEATVVQADKNKLVRSLRRRRLPAAQRAAGRPAAPCPTGSPCRPRSRARAGVALLLQVHKLGVQARDLRLMDPNLATTYPSAILCREKAMVINLEYIKAIITTSSIMVRSSPPAPPSARPAPTPSPFPPLLPSAPLQADANPNCSPPPARSAARLPLQVVNPEDEATLPFITELKLKLGQAGMPSAGSFAVLNDAAAKGPKQSTTALAGLDMPFELRALEVCLDSVGSGRRMGGGVLRPLPAGLANYAPGAAAGAACLLRAGRHAQAATAAAPELGARAGKAAAAAAGSAGRRGALRAGTARP
jgi:hypothetical protein